MTIFTFSPFKNAFFYLERKAKMIGTWNIPTRVQKKILLLSNITGIADVCKKKLKIKEIFSFNIV